LIPYGRQDVTQADIDAVAEVLRSDLITQGPVVPRFEQAVAGRVGAQHAVAVNSGTSALHIACAAMGLGAGGLLWTVPNTFVASANCARYCGADVDFVDIEPGTWNLSTAALQSKLSQARVAGRLPDIVVPVHFGGQPTDQEEIHALAREYGFRVLEDASHAIGASRHGEPVGSCRWSDVTVFSFHPVKIVTTAEGGMAMTQDPELAERMRMLRSHGITRDPARLQAGAGAPPAWYYEQQLLGYNYRLTDIQAALGMSQLERIEAYVERRNQLARRYDEALAGLPLELPRIAAGNRSAFHLYVVRIVEDGARNRLRVFEELRRCGIGANVHYIPVHLQPYYRALGFRDGLCPVAEAYGESAITLPLFPALTFEQQDVIVAALRSAL
jgi:UDP-4-amino-4,6-dideoxy-N-acetyl-beta-L-altrosamine transaminase